MVEAAAGHRHDARVLVGEIDLVFRQRSLGGRLRRLAARLLARLRSSGRPRRELGLVLRKLALITLLGARLDLRARLSDFPQALLAPRQFFGDRHPVGNLRRVRRLGLGQQFGHLGLQLRFDLARVLVRKRAVPAGVGVNLRAVQRHRAHLQNAHLARQQQHLNEQRLDLFQKPPPERRDGVVIGMIVGGDEAERNAVIGRPLELATRKNARRVAVDQQSKQHRGMIRRRAGAAIIPAHRSKIEAVDHLDHETRQMALRQPLVDRGRKQKSGLPVNRAEIAQQRTSRRKAESTHRFYPIPLNALSPTGSRDAAAPQLRRPRARRRRRSAGGSVACRPATRR